MAWWAVVTLLAVLGPLVFAASVVVGWRRPDVFLTWRKQP